MLWEKKVPQLMMVDYHLDLTLVNYNLVKKTLGLPANLVSLKFEN